MSNPLMRGIPGYSHANYLPQHNGSPGEKGGLGLSGSAQTYIPNPYKGAAGIQINFNPMDYSGFYENKPVK